LRRPRPEPEMGPYPLWPNDWPAARAALHPSTPALPLTSNIIASICCKGRPSSDLRIKLKQPTPSASTHRPYKTLHIDPSTSGSKTYKPPPSNPNLGDPSPKPDLPISRPRTEKDFCFELCVLWNGTKVAKDVLVPAPLDTAQLPCGHDNPPNLGHYHIQKEEVWFLAPKRAPPWPNVYSGYTLSLPATPYIQPSKMAGTKKAPNTTVNRRVNGHPILLRVDGQVDPYAVPQTPWTPHNCWKKETRKSFRSSGQIFGNLKSSAKSWVLGSCWLYVRCLESLLLF